MAAKLKRWMTRSDSKNSDLVLSNEVKMEIDSSNWTIPEQKIEEIYKVGLFDFKVAMTIKIHEETRSVNEQFQTIHLLNDQSLQKYINNGYRYIHIGLVQVAVKPLVHMGVDAPIFMALRDKRLKRRKSSLLALIQTNTCNGPIYFNCAPNYSLDMTDPLIMDSLVLDIHLQGNEFHKNCKNFAIIYKVYFKLLSSQTRDIDQFM